MNKNGSQHKDISGRDPESGRFLAGNHASPGRKLGSRVKLSEDFLRSLHQEWQRSGDAALAHVAKNRPDIFCRIVAGLLPAQLQGELDVRIGLFQQAANTNQAYKIAMAYLHNKIRDDDDPALIEDHHNGG
jgi:hypothetical protein